MDTMRDFRSSCCFELILIFLALWGVPSISEARSSLCHARSAKGSDLCSWAEGFNRPGFDGEVLASAVWDDGSGPTLYVGGDFHHFGTEPLEYIARWDGEGWSAVEDPVTGGLNAPVLLLDVYDDGQGENLFAAGNLLYSDGQRLSSIACWDGGRWSTLIGSDENVLMGQVRAQTVLNTGSGDEIFVAGYLRIGNASSGIRIARWDGADWHSTGWFSSGPAGNPSFEVLALTAFDGELYAVARTRSGGSYGDPYLRRLDGDQWIEVPGIQLLSIATEPTITLMAVEFGAHRGLYVGAPLRLEVDGGSFGDIARWDGSSWSPLEDSSGNGLGHAVGFGDLVVRSILLSDLGSGERVIVGGHEELIPEDWIVTTAAFVASWDGNEWSRLNDDSTDAIDSSSVADLSLFDDGSSSAVYATGRNIAHAGEVLGQVARLRNGEWSRLVAASGAGIGTGSGAIYDFLEVPNGAQEILYAAGSFTIGGSLVTPQVGRWDGTEWSALVGENGRSVCDVLECTAITKLQVVGQGDEALIYAGTLRASGTKNIVEVGRWDGTRWQRLKSPYPGYDSFDDMAVFDDGSGPQVYVTGYFTEFSTPVGLLRYDGDRWSIPDGAPGEARSLEMWDDGTGQALYVAGWFGADGGIPVNGIGRWNGSSWSYLEDVGSSIFPGVEEVTDMATFDDGSGPGLVVACRDGVYRWDGGQWTSLLKPDIGSIWEVAAYDDSAGESLYAGGEEGIARWNGASWDTICPIASDQYYPGVFALLQHDDGAGPSLFVGGRFDKICDVSSAGIARLDCPHFDFGDAPDPPYRSQLANDGPRHEIVAGLYLGQGVDYEADARVGHHGHGDTHDDGVRFLSPVLPGLTARIAVQASAAAKLDGWIDFNGDGDWADSGERIFNRRTIQAGSHELSFNSPPEAVIGTVCIARFRLSSNGVGNPTGPAPDGEVEDYEIRLGASPYAECRDTSAMR